MYLIHHITVHIRNTCILIHLLQEQRREGERRYWYRIVQCYLIMEDQMYNGQREDLLIPVVC